ncbi:hypothetical protein FSP39_006404 [Pinctada imbricata]|uniref:CARD domain-containing protein n=1 Tax=Pinctada imbricata TaxID=66713 RepID=A0AA88XQB8_PINIB|nr:hypothetical protein FSP39_006404 [Pinctada imbricata]
MSDMGSLSGIDRQNVMRLRVNRIALVQELRIEHILQPLMDTGVISESDKRRIDVGTTPADKARRLIDIVTAKTQVPDWYQKFRDAMINPLGANSEVKKRYRSLVEFLDNTVIHRPTSQASKFSASSSTSSMKLPHYQPLPEISNEEKSKRRTQNVLKLDEDRKKPPMYDGEEKGARDTVPERDDKMVGWVEISSQTVTLVKGFFQQWVSVPDNYRSLIQVPEEHIQRIAGGNTADDKSQLVQETLVLERVKKLELIAVLSRRKQLPQGFELCMCEAVQEILFDQDNYHFYFKYLRQLEVQEVNLLLDVVDSYASIMSNMDPSKGSSENTKQAIKLGFCLIDFLGDYGYYTQAELIMTVLLMVLNQSHNLDIWLAKYKGYVKLMHYRNLNYEFLKVHSAYHLANEMKWQIKMMSFGQNYS